jgi:hypothetical protein
LLSDNIKIKIYRTILLSVVLYKCETLSLTLREEHRLREFGNRVLRETFGTKVKKVTEDWRKLHNEELHHLQSSPNIIWVIKSWRMRWWDMWERRGAYRALVWKPEGKKPLGRPRCKWYDNIKTADKAI